MSVGDYLTNKYALWLDFRTIDENTLHRTGRRIENASEGITLQTEDTELAGNLNAYIYLIMDAQLNIQNRVFNSVDYQEKMPALKKPYMALIVAPTGVGKTHLALDLLEKEYLNHFDYVIIICPTLRYNETYQ